MFLLVDKPKGMTSHDVVDYIRKVAGIRKVGHAGTLDPNATGLLIIGIGRESTKKLGTLAKGVKKTYKAEVYLGEERNTDDVEGVTITKVKGYLQPMQKEITNLLKGFVGTQMQTPPAFSAVKKSGKKAYQLARSGKQVSLKPRKITVYSIELISYTYPVLAIKTCVSSGTYIRALARDIGQRLGCGAYLLNLRRIKIGRYDIERAYQVNHITSGNWKKLAIEIN